METNPRGGYEPQQSQLTLQIIWWAILFSVIIYGLVVWVVAGTDPPSIPWNEMPVLALLAAGVVMLLAASVIPSVLLRAGRSISSGTEVAPAYGVAARVQRALIVRFSLLEAAAICGLVAALFGQSLQLYLPLGLLAIIGFSLNFPGDGLIRRLDSE